MWPMYCDPGFCLFLVNFAHYLWMAGCEQESLNIPVEECQKCDHALGSGTFTVSILIQALKIFITGLRKPKGYIDLFAFSFINRTGCGYLWFQGLWGCLALDFRLHSLNVVGESILHHL